MEQCKGNVSTSQGEVPDPGRQTPIALGAKGGAERGGSVPCLYSNISTEPTEDTPPDNLRTLTPYHKKAAHALAENVERFCSLYGIDNCGFLTLTFAENIKDHREASRRFNSMNTHYMSQVYGQWIWARERQKRGAWHYHLVVQCKGDIRTGFDWDEFLAWISDRENGKRRRLKTGNHFLRSLWEMNNRAFPSYGFGRVELLPIRSSTEAVARYVGKYISKQIGQRPEEDKGVRLTGHSQGFVASKPQFAWNTEGAKEWRRKLALFAQLSCGCADYADFIAHAGPKWAYRYKHLIQDYDTHLETRYPDPPF